MACYGAVGDIYLSMVSRGGSLDTNLLADGTRKELSSDVYW